MDDISAAGRSGGATSPGPANDLEKAGHRKDPSAAAGNPLECPTGSACLYRPSNGTAGAGFQEHWCDHCARDAAFRDGGPDVDPALGCQILAATFVYEITDPKYPKEWIYGPDGWPKCTAFTTDPKCPVRCEKTIDMFAR
jgi:hypothetical protein